MRTKPPNKPAEDVLREQQQLKAFYHRVFTSPDGWKVYRDLRQRFSGELLNASEHLTFANVGSYRVIQFIEDMMEGPHGNTESDN